MELVYISGSYRDKRPNGVFNNIIKAREKALEYWKKGYAVICPHMNTAFMDGELPDEAWLDGDIEMVKRCDIIVMLKGWENSEGAKIELECAKKHNLKIIYG